MSNDKLIRGTLILSITTMLSKILGFIYVAPLTGMVGVNGYVLFEYAYKPYALMISLATMGLPLAVSKFVSKYNGLGDYQMGRLMLRRGLYLLSFTGLFCFFVLYFSAPLLAQSLVGKSDGTGNSIDDVVFVVRMISVALIIVPPMALLRGFFQGYQWMEPTGVSQVWEQFFRVVFIFVGAYAALHIFHWGRTIAVGLATFAAFIGAIIALFTLLRYWKKHKPELDEKLATSKPASDMSTFRMFKELFSYAIPFVVVGLAITLYQTVDTFMINKALVSVNYSLEKAEQVNSIVALVQKVAMIPVSVASGFGLSLVPAITKSFTEKNMKLVHNQITKSFKVVLFLTLPAVAGMMALGSEIYALMFGPQFVDLGGKLMIWYAPVAIVYSFFTITAAMLQGLNKQNFAVVSTLIGLAIKVAINIPMIQHFESLGTVISTLIGFAVTIGINLWVIKRASNYEYRPVIQNTAWVAVATIAMVVSIYLAKLGYPFIEGLVSSVYMQYLVEGIVGICIGGIIYVALSLSLNIYEKSFEQPFPYHKFKKFIPGVSKK